MIPIDMLNLYGKLWKQKQIRFSYNKGYLALFSNRLKKWLYADNEAPIDDEIRPCVKCGCIQEKGQPDTCLGTLPGVKFACCGHGDINGAYITFENGVTVRGFNRVEVENKEGKTIFRTLNY